MASWLAVWDIVVKLMVMALTTKNKDRHKKKKQRLKIMPNAHPKGCSFLASEYIYIYIYIYMCVCVWLWLIAFKLAMSVGKCWETIQWNFVVFLQWNFGVVFLQNLTNWETKENQGLNPQFFSYWSQLIHGYGNHQSVRMAMATQANSFLVFFSSICANLKCVFVLPAVMLWNQLHGSVFLHDGL